LSQPAHPAKSQVTAPATSSESVQAIHSRIDAAELPVIHETRRQGRPFTLVLTKAEALFTREREARITDETDLEWLAAQWNPAPDRCGY
jgi:hypothetical protein